MLFTNWNVNAKRNKVPNAPICWNSEQLGNKISLDRHRKFLRKRKFYIFWTWHALTQVSLILGLTQNLIWSRTAEFYLEFPKKWEEISVAIEKTPEFLTFIFCKAGLPDICPSFCGFYTYLFYDLDISTSRHFWNWFLGKTIFFFKWKSKGFLRLGKVGEFVQKLWIVHKQTVCRL